MESRLVTVRPRSVRAGRRVRGDNDKLRVGNREWGVIGARKMGRWWSSNRPHPNSANVRNGNRGFQRGEESGWLVGPRHNTLRVSIANDSRHEFQVFGGVWTYQAFYFLNGRTWSRGKISMIREIWEGREILNREAAHVWPLTEASTWRRLIFKERFGEMQGSGWSDNGCENKKEIFGGVPYTYLVTR